MENPEALDGITDGLFIARHSTHNLDIQMSPFLLGETIGRVPRGLFHYHIVQFFPIVRWLGGSPGTRSTAKHIIKQGHFAACIPGGGKLTTKQT